jgi:hypothetical protein
VRFAVEFDHQHPATAFTCGSGQNRGYRGLPDTTLAGHDDHPGAVQELTRIEALRRHVCAD